MAPLSDEEENYVRLALLLKGVTPRAVRTYFDREFPPTYLPSTLNTNYNTLMDLKLKRIINQAQWNLLIPRNGDIFNTYDKNSMIIRDIDPTKDKYINNYMTPSSIQ
ncbi:Hypothetical predicted protein [Mytilus galloprovincialis]|uniref:Uncharacterized protein n=1 Tax=Mytilus galloprovincialis TaxID=29158 RepID=A0A8B6GD02_MYTGA|nr:Hypothetical predicted protein [Mytilus galloprovincialis]